MRQRRNRQATGTPEQQELATGRSVPLFDRTDDGICRFQEMVLDHYDRYGRKMPWRETDDPYRILVSEIMLQQTQVGRVMIKYGEFIDAFPDFSSLAEAPLSSILSVWQGLGYNRRAIALRDCAIRISDEYGGVLPRDPEVLATFPGIGAATAASICAFAFNLPVVFIETNIRRVFIHYFFDDKATVSDREILPLVARALPRDRARIWYWALMDLGTALKMTTPNPNRRSIHYSRQSPFEGSDRRLRGMMLRHFLPGSDMAVKDVLAAFDEDPARMHKILNALEQEGFIYRTGDRIRLAS